MTWLPSSYKISIYFCGGISPLADADYGYGQASLLPASISAPVTDFERKQSTVYISGESPKGANFVSYKHLFLDFIRLFIDFTFTFLILYTYRHLVCTYEFIFKFLSIFQNESRLIIFHLPGHS